MKIGNENLLSDPVNPSRFSLFRFKSLRHQASTSLARNSFAVLVLASLLISCSPRQQTISCPQPALPADTAARLKQTSAIQLSLLLDGTLSMQGFVRNSASGASLDSQYRKTLRLIDSAAATGWSNAAASAKYYRFGTRKQAIDRETFLKAQLPAFYQGGSDFSTSRIDAALGEPGNENLSVILTDLYQKDADVGLLQKLLSQRYLEQGYAIGIIGIKSEFQGTIYDVGIANQSFAYSTAGKPASAYHPFYVLLIGSYGNIHHFYNQLQRNGLTAIQHELVVFTPQPVAQAAMLNPDQVQIPTRKDIVQPKALNDGSVMLRKATGEPVQFLVVSRKTGTEPLEITTAYAGLAGLPAIDPTTLNLAIQAERYRGQSQGFQASPAQGLQLSDWVIQNQSLEFKLQIKPDQLETGTYRFNIDASPTDLVAQTWWEAWNASEGSLEGAKTNNLLPFLRGLNIRTAELMKQQKPVIARLCFAVQKK